MAAGSDAAGAGAGLMGPSMARLLLVRGTPDDPRLGGSSGNADRAGGGGAGVANAAAAQGQAVRTAVCVAAIIALAVSCGSRHALEPAFAQVGRASWV
jgi:hypothetical protein